MEKLMGLNRLLAMVIEPILEEYDRLKEEIRYSPGRHRNYHRNNIKHIHDFSGYKFWRAEDE